MIAVDESEKKQCSYLSEKTCVSDYTQGKVRQATIGK